MNKSIQQTNILEKSQVFKDYTPKITNKLYDKDNPKEKCEDINSLVILLNWCFHTKNNFFIEDFNKRLVHPVCDSYNKLKTNILSPDIFYNIDEVFKDIPKENIKTLKFILFRYINIFDSISEETNTFNTHLLCQKVSKKSIKNCIVYMTNYVSKLSK